ncbi:CD209 antigen-like protein E isoform X2 [Lates calcarifer]|uniref:CD209 antigen-like protein E isoform X2 n=1 Tax=Lates calcarifer TaxID=8187 RepID=A0AAJ8AYM7_LATCA|nr:CD209 antigen-like protein E isoform X2 [Lates calcarifer]
MSRPQGYTEGEAPGSQQTKSTRRSKVTSERVALLVLCALMAAAVIVIYRLSLDHFQTKKNLQTLRDENEALKRNLTERLSETKPHTTVPPVCPRHPEVKINDSCLKCETGWEQHGGQCYYFSTRRSSWKESRSFCKRRGGDLVKIDSREEQSFLEKTVRKKMDHDEDLFWIGLTDSKTEGEWLWVDDSPLNTSLSFWMTWEPDNWTVEDPDGENCARIGAIRDYDLIRWYDRSCKVNQKYICEKEAETGEYMVSCV